MTEYIVEPKSRKDLRNLANILRNYLGLKNTLWIPIVEVLEILPEILGNSNYLWSGKLHLRRLESTATG